MDLITEYLIPHIQKLWETRLNTYDKAGIIVLCIGAIIILLYSICSLFTKEHKNKRIRKKIAKRRILYYKDFESHWIPAAKARKKRGFKYNDMPGCYVITLYKKKIHHMTPRKYLKYKNIYIGQSIHIHQRVHNHLSGKGKGDVYADIKYGAEAYICFVPCKAEKMNDLERTLIRAFHATDSYNITSGGSKHRT